MKIRNMLLCLVLLLPVMGQAQAVLPKKGAVPHPRLLLKNEDVEAVRELIGRDKYARIVDSTVMAFCAKRIEEPFYTQERDQAGTRLIYLRQVNKNIHLFSYAARIHNRADYRERAIEEMLRLCQWKNWNPEHFLDPSEASLAVSVCYDWFYDYLTPKQRKLVRNALLDLAVMPSFEKHPDHYFYSPTNWSSVCNCGILAAALALYEEDSATAQRVLDRCLDGNRVVLKSYDPTGAYPEGFNYWSFGTRHEVLLLDMLEGVFGTDFGMSTATPGFMLTPYFILHMTGPFGMAFNYGDCPPKTTFHPAVFWFAQKNYDPSLFFLEQKQLTSGEDITVGAYACLAAMLKWYSKAGADGERKVPVDLFYENSEKKIPLFIYRSSWESEDAAYIGIRGGSVRKVNHSHIDVGSFVYYKDRVRWVADLGSPNYSFVEKYLGHNPLFTIKQEAARWDVLREGAHGHSVVTFDDQRPVIDCQVPFVRVFRAPNQKGALMDLTSMYPEYVKSYHRMVYLDAQDDLVVTEKFVGGAQSHKLRWTLVTETDATVDADGSVLLRKNGLERRLRFSVTGKTASGMADAPALAVSVDDAVTDKPYDEPNPGFHLIHLDFTLEPGSTVNLISILR